MSVIWEDRELLAELARVNTDMATLGMKIMAGSATAGEQRHYAERLIAAGERLKRRAAAMGGTVIEGAVETSHAHGEQSVAIPFHTVEPVWRHPGGEAIELNWQP